MPRILTSDQIQFLEKFKTSKCSKRKCDIKNCDCYHDNSDKRRNPFISIHSDTYSYSYFICKSGENGEICLDNQCRKAHSKNEIEYHPNVSLIFSLTCII